jgi:hypothetical protein
MTSTLSHHRLKWLGRGRSGQTTAAACRLPGCRRIVKRVTGGGHQAAFCRKAHLDEYWRRREALLWAIDRCNTGLSEMPAIPRGARVGPEKRKAANDLADALTSDRRYLTLLLDNYPRFKGSAVTT